MILPNYHKLALFVCHLFIDGKFRTAHILFDPKIFDNLLISEIYSVCSDPIPLLTTDITKSSIGTAEEYAQHGPTLQLIFFDPEHLPKRTIRFRHQLAFYRLFIFCTPDQMDVKKTTSVLQKLNLFESSNSLILNLVQTTNNINRFWISSDGAIMDYSFDDENKEATSEPTNTLRSDQSSALSIKQDRQMSSIKPTDFNQVFGIYEKNWKFAIRSIYGNPCFIVEKSLYKQHGLYLTFYLSTFFRSQLHGNLMKHVYETCTTFDKTKSIEIWVHFKSYNEYYSVRSKQEK